MKITGFKIRNFRSLKDVAMDDLGNLNVIVGKNGSGKSNIFEGLAFAFASFSAVGGSTGGLNDYVWYNRQTKEPIEFSAVLSLDDKDVPEAFPKEFLEDLTAGGVDFRTISFSRKLDLQGQWRTDYLRVGGRTLVLDDKQVTGEAPAGEMPGTGAQPPSAFPTQQAGAALSKVAERIRSAFKLISAVRDVGNRSVPERMGLVSAELQARLWDWDQSPTDSEHDRYTGVEADFTATTDLKLDLAGGQVFVKKSRRIPIASEGGGVQASLNLIFSLGSQMDGNIFSIEEPESHSHFEYQKRLFDVVRRCAETNQVFIATHSPVFVDRADSRNSWLVKLTEDGTVVQRVTELKAALEQVGARTSDVFFSADRLVLVGGEHDKIIVSALARVFGKDLTDVLVVPFGGRDGAGSHLETWVGATRGAVPAYLVLDSDARAEAEQLVKSGKLDPSTFHVWKLGAIEEYYPADILREALENLSNRYNADINADRIMKQIEKGETKASGIDLGEKGKNLGRPFRIVLAEEVAGLLPKAKDRLPDEVSIALDEAIP